MASFEHTDPPFTANAPPLSATEPALPFVGAARWRFPSGSRQDDPPHTARERRLFILGGGKSAIRRGDMRRATEDLDVANQVPASTASCPLVGSHGPRTW